MMSDLISLFAFLFWFSIFAPLVKAFSFTTSGTPTQCDSFSISWEGGQPPFQLIITPAFGTPSNISIPAEAFNGGRGSFSFPLPLPEKKKFILTMSDVTGFASGGSTSLFTTGPSKGGSCDTRGPNLDFSYELNTALQQCRPYPFSGYSGAIQPITIIGQIPGGQTFILHPPPGSSTFSWTANVAAGNSILFTVIDSQGRNGGTSDVATVGSSDDETCLNNLSPSSTAISTTQTSGSPTSSHSQASSGTPTSNPSPSSESEKKTPIAAIAGTVIGALVFLAVAITLGLFFLRNRRDKKRPRTDLDLTYDPTHHSNYPYPSGAAAATSASPLHLSAATGGYDAPYSDAGNVYHQPPYQQADYNAPSPQQTYSQYPSPSSPQPFSQYQQSQSQYSLSSHYQQPQNPSNDDPFNPYTVMHDQPGPANIRPFDVHSSDQHSLADSASMTASQRKAAMAGVSTYTPTRFIVHTDVEDELPPPNPDGVVELPPQYSERRGHTAAGGSTNIASSSGS